MWAVVRRGSCEGLAWALAWAGGWAFTGAMTWSFGWPVHLCAKEQPEGLFACVRAGSPCVGQDLGFRMIFRVDGRMEELGVLRWIEAHCRHAAGQLPRGEDGCATAMAVLAAMPAACARRLPDLTDTAPRLWDALVSYGLLSAAPSRRIRVAALNLLARVSPLFARRSPRQWSVWFAQALDPESALSERLRVCTPASQLAVEVPAPSPRPPRTRDLRRELTQRRQEIEEARRTIETLQRRLRVAEEHDRTVAAAEASLVAERAALRQSSVAGETELTRLREDLAAKTKTLEGARRRVVELEADRQNQVDEVKKLQARCDRAEAAERSLSSRVQVLTRERDEQRQTIETLERGQAELGAEIRRGADALAEAHRSATALDRENEELKHELVLKDEMIVHVRQLHHRRHIECGLRRQLSPPLDEVALAAEVERRMRETVPK